MTENRWTEYWSRDEVWAQSELWKINADVFLRRIAPWISFTPADTVLNIGCGAGHLERMLAPKVSRIHVVDTSDQYLEQLKKTCEGFKNVTVQRLGRVYTDLLACPGKFSVILCISVVQYYRGMHEIADLIRSARGIAAPGAKMVIADWPRRRGRLGSVWDSLGAFLMSVRGGYTPALVKAFFASRKDRAYRSVSEDAPSLTFTLQDIRNLIRSETLDATLITGSLSAVANRPSLLIRL